ncbi:glycosyltransferase [Patescibacteria group bacterium]|nr:glycosyltransferase [Patescibacteria group bacterium]MBU1963337.1 glycosyltransferase [Patescibacteria group bacterium]
MKKKVLIITPYLGRAGMERSLGLLLDKLDYEKFEVSFLYFKKLYKKDESSYLEDILNKKKIKFFYKPFKRGLSLIKMSKKIKEVIVEVKPDVVLAREWFQAIASVRAKQKSEHKPKVIGDLRNNMEREFLAHVKIPPLQKTYKKLLHQVDQLVCISEGVADNMHEKFKISKNKLVVIHNGFDFDLLKGTGEQKRKSNVILAVGRLAPQKDYPTLLKAFRLVRDKTDAELWIIGDGDLEKKLKKQADMLGISEHIKWLGYQKNPFKYMKQATVFALSSAWEGFGNVITEAMACQCPVVSTDCPYGPSEIISHNKDGYLVTVGDFEKLADHIIKLLDDPALRQKIAFNGLNTVKTAFSPDNMVQAYERLFSKT